MTTLYALLVGINDYPDPRQRLYGCLNDVAGMNGFLRRYAGSQQLGFRTRMLRNEEATRQAVIHAFSHFDQAGDGDICLFFFSGHGSFAEAPDEFWYNTSGRNESIVCYDSRTSLGRDLMDKEIAYLIWRATHEKNVHFLTVMDCCHAGSSTRTIAGARERWIPPAHTPLVIEDYLGYEFYHRRDNGELAPPMGRHVLLAASRDNETAKEDMIDGAVRGVFTCALLRELEQGGIFASYGELMQRASITVQGLAVQQHPQLETVDVDTRTGFLGVDPKRGIPHQIFFDASSGNWVLDAGSIQNIAPPTPEMETLLELEDGSIIKVTDVQPTRSVVSGMEAKATDHVYRAWLKQNGLPPAPLYLHHSLPEEWRRVLEKQMAGYTSLRLTGEEASARYVVKPYEGSLILTRRGEATPLFKRVPVNDNTIDRGSHIFLRDVADVANWEHVLLQHNPNSQFNSEDLKIEVFVFTDPDFTHDATQKNVLVNPHKPIELRYFRVNGKWREPGYQVRLTNLNPLQSLWVSGLVLTSDFGIMNQFLPKQELQPGQEVWMSYTTPSGVLYNTLEAYIDQAYLTWGVNDIRDYIKVYASTSHQLNTNSLVQDAIELDTREGVRSVSRGQRVAIGQPSLHDWFTKTIELRIFRPLDETPLSADSPAELPGLTLEVPAGFSAKASLASLQAIIRALDAPLPPAFWTYDGSGVLSITRGIGSSDGLEVLEIIDARGRELITAESPLIVRLRQQPPSKETVIPIGFDTNSRSYVSIGRMDETGAIHICQLMEDTPSIERSTGKSVKVFFHRTTFRNAGGPGR